MHSNKRTNPFKTIIGALFVSLLLIQLVFTLFQGVTVAADTSKLETNVKSYIYYVALEKCMQGGTFSSGYNEDFINPDDATKYKFFGATQENPNIGYLKAGGGPADCDVIGEWIRDALTLWGWADPVNALCDFKFRRDTAGNGSTDAEKCVNGGGNFSPSADRVTDYKRAVELKFYGKQGRPTLSAEANYVLYLNTFTTLCIAKPLGPVAGATPSQKTIASSNNGYTVDILGAKYERVPTIYQADLGRGDKVDAYTGKEVTCEEAVKEINKNFAAYQKYMNANKATEPAPSAAAPTAGVGANGSQSPSCYSGIPVFGWALCPFLDFADGVYSFAQEQISQLLFIDDNAFGSDLRDSWSVVRNFASAGIVLVALFMVASQIFSFEFMSAYSVKKILPRLVIAAIFIQLSWFIFTTLIMFVNAVGVGIYSLLTSPFQGGADIMNIAGQINQQSPVAVAFTSTAIFAGIIAAGVVGVAALFTPGALLTLVFAAIGVIIAIIMIVFTLVVRKILIIVLLALAPIAILAWILPNTQRFWDMWWKLFSKLLLMFPLIMILFAAGVIAANIVATTGDPGPMDFIIVIIAYFAPLFLIPATFKFAGGMFTNIVAGINKAGSKARGYGWMGTKARAKESYQQNRKERGIELANTSRTGIRGRVARTRGRLMAGTAGARGGYADRLRASEEQEYIKHASLEYSDRMKGVEFPEQVNLSERIASAQTGEVIHFEHNGERREIVVTEAMQRVSGKFLADTGRSDQLRRVEERLRSTGRTSLWNTIQGENAGQITKINPDQVGKNFWDISATEMADMKPETFRNMRAAMADPEVSAEQKQRITRQLRELMGNETLRAKLGGDSLAHVNDMLSNNPQRQTRTTQSGLTSRIDHLGNAEYVDRFDEDDNWLRTEANPEFRDMHEVRDNDGAVTERRSGW